MKSVSPNCRMSYVFKDELALKNLLTSQAPDPIPTLESAFGQTGASRASSKRSGQSWTRAKSWSLWRLSREEENQKEVGLLCVDLAGGAGRG